MRSFRNHLLSTVVGASALLTAGSQTVRADHDDDAAVGRDYEHVLLISVDGMHAIDLANWVRNHPASNFAKLASHGIIYPNAFTTAPSDSYPGMIAQVTGAIAEEWRAVL